MKPGLSYLRLAMQTGKPALGHAAAEQPYSKGLRRQAARKRGSATIELRNRRCCDPVPWLTCRGCRGRQRPDFKSLPATCAAATGVIFLAGNPISLKKNSFLADFAARGLAPQAKSEGVVLEGDLSPSNSTNQNLPFHTEGAEGFAFCSFEH